jgi:hypothetical protein
MKYLHFCQDNYQIYVENHYRLILILKILFILLIFLIFHYWTPNIFPKIPKIYKNGLLM